MLTNYASPTRFSNAKKKINNKSVYFPSEQRRKYHCHDGADLITITPHYIHIVLMRRERPVGSFGLFGLTQLTATGRSLFDIKDVARLDFSTDLASSIEIFTFHHFFYWFVDS